MYHSTRLRTGLEFGGAKPPPCDFGRQRSVGIKLVAREFGKSRWTKKILQTRPVWLLFIIPLLLLILLTGITVIGAHLLGQSDGDMTSQIKGLGVLVVIIAVISLLIGSLLLYSSARYIQLPVWRWIASGLKGEPNLTWMKKSKKPEVKDTLNQIKKTCVWLGRICSVVGTILIINGVVWRWIFIIRGERTVGRIPSKLLLAGAFILIAGLCIIRISMPTANNNGAKKDKGRP